MIINISTKKNETGVLSFFESQKDIPFAIKRIYYITNVKKNDIRGFHAHKQLNQLLFCPYGEIEIMLDDGYKIENIILDNPSKGLIIGSGVWHEMKWLINNSVLCVAASEYYDENDYIRSYGEFKRLIEGGYWNENRI